MPIRTIDNSSELERSLQTNVYDLHTSSVNLRMQDIFARNVEQTLPLLVQTGHERLAEQFQQRFRVLMEEYKQLGTPKRLRDDADRAYLARVREFADDLRTFVETTYPIRVEFIP